MTKTAEQLNQSAYEKCLPHVERTHQFLNGLMVAVRPVIVELSEDPVMGYKSPGRYPTLRQATQSTELEQLAERVFRVQIKDEYETGKPRRDATLLTSTVRIDSDACRPGTDRMHASTLTWGSAASSILSTAADTDAGVGAYYARDVDRLDIYDSPGEVVSDYTRAYATRAASGLLVAQMVHGFSVANGGRPLDIEHIGAQAAELINEWSTFDEATVTRVLEPIQQIQPAL